MSEAKLVAALVCGTSNSGFESRQAPLEDAAKWLATGLENQGTGNCKGSIPSSSVSCQIQLIVPMYCRDTAVLCPYRCGAIWQGFDITTRSRKARHRADNAAIGGAVPPWWIFYGLTIGIMDILHHGRCR